MIDVVVGPEISNVLDVEFQEVYEIDAWWGVGSELGSLKEK